MKKLIKKNYKFILGIIIGLIWSSGIAYAATILFDSDEVSYDNTTSGLSATNVQSALDELYVESTSYQLFESRVSSIESKLYPVGSYYETSDSSFNPNTNSNWTGTWTKETMNNDYIVGEGTSGIWTYRKWNSGFAESWVNYSGSAAQAYNLAGAIGCRVIELALPASSDIKFTSFLNVSAYLNTWNSGYLWASGKIDATTNTVRIMIYANSVSTAYAYNGSLKLEGYWKTYTAPSTIYRWHRTA